MTHQTMIMAMLRKYGELCAEEAMLSHCVSVPKDIKESVRKDKEQHWRMIDNAVRMLQEDAVKAAKRAGEETHG